MRNHWELKDRRAMRRAFIRCSLLSSLVSDDCAMVVRLLAKVTQVLVVRRIELSYALQLHLDAYHDIQALASPRSVYEPQTARRVYVTTSHDTSMMY